MESLKQIATMMKLKTLELIDFHILPRYKARRQAIFDGIGTPAPPIPLEAAASIETATKITESQGGFVSPDALALEWINAHLSSSVWTQKGDESPFNKSEFLVSGVAVQTNPDSGNKDIMVMLKDRFDNRKQPVPLFVLLERFQPLSDLEPRDYDS